MLVSLTKEYRERYKQMEQLVIWLSGEKQDHSLLQLEDFPIGFIKGDYGSQISREHTSISRSELHSFCEQCSGDVFYGTGRIIFEREVVIAFTDKEDAALFKLTWG